MPLSASGDDTLQRADCASKRLQGRRQVVDNTIDACTEAVIIVYGCHNACKLLDYYMGRISLAWTLLIFVSFGSIA